MRRASLTRGAGGVAGRGGEGGDGSAVEIEGESLLAALRGDTDLSQAFGYLAQAFVGCDWSGHVRLRESTTHGGHPTSRCCLIDAMSPSAFNRCT